MDTIVNGTRNSRFTPISPFYKIYGIPYLYKMTTRPTRGHAIMEEKVQAISNPTFMTTFNHQQISSRWSWLAFRELCPTPLHWSYPRYAMTFLLQYCLP